MRTINAGLLLAAVALALSGCQPVLHKTHEPAAPASMSVDDLLRQLQDQVTGFQGSRGRWQFTFDGVPMALLTSTTHNRMRIIAPIVSSDQVTAQQVTEMLEANFHSALDPRYSMSKGIVYAAYIHPLSPLQPAEIRSALSQVAQLVKNFGTTYSSSALRFSEPDAAPARNHPSPADTPI